VGIETAVRLAQELQPQDLTGSLIIISPVNVSGFENRTMSVVAEDGKNLNRIFPGSPDGTVGDKLCWFLDKECLSLADYCIDLHCGDGYESLTPYVYFVGAADEEVVEKAREMARRINAPYMVRSLVKSGGAYNVAGSRGIPSILIERGGQAQWSEEEVAVYIADVLNVLKHLKLISGDEAENENQPIEIVDVVYDNATHTGCFYPTKKVGEFIKKDEVYGVIKDYFGKTLDTFRAKMDAVILYQVSSLCIIEGGSMICYGALEVAGSEN
jgi:hypothetical protein